MQSETNPHVQNELKPGEHLLWWSKPDLAHRAKTHTSYINPIIMAILAIFTLWLTYNAWNLLIEEIGFGAGFQTATLFLFIFCVFVFISFLARIFLFYYQIQKNRRNLLNTTYAITDRRIIVITATSKGVAVKSHTRGDIGQLVRAETGGGWGDVSYGVPRTQQAGLRSVTVVDKLTGVPNAGLVEDILMRTFKNSQPVPPPGWYPSYPQQQPYPPPPQYYTQPPAAQPPVPTPSEFYPSQPAQAVPPAPPLQSEQPVPKATPPQEEPEL